MPLLQVAIARFEQDRVLRNQLDAAQTQLSERKLIERAKGILMSMKGLTEDEAYKQLRRKAMNEKRKIADIARAIVTTADLLG
jgi:two-component system, response regulator / RNA-binding antiterminator